MEELVQDFVCALDESDIKIGQDVFSETSATSPKYDRERKKRSRKRRTISASLQFSNPGNSFSKVTGHLSDCSSSSLDDKEFHFKSIHTYSADSDELLSCCGSKKHLGLTPNSKDHCYQHRKNKQPVLVESDSYTENGAIPLNISRKIRKKRIKKMNVESHDNSLFHHKQFTRLDKSNTKYRLKSVDHLKFGKCLNECNNLPPTAIVENKFETCTIKRADDSFSGTSSENDSINDELGDGQLGDDEMTDYFHEPETSDSVCGIPYRVFPYACSRSLHMRLSQCQSQDESMDTSLVEHKLREIYNQQAIAESIKGYHSRINRLPGLAARSIRRARRRSKIKKPHQGGCSIDKLEVDNSELKAIKSKRRKVDNCGEAFDLMDELIFKTSNFSDKLHANLKTAGSSKRRNNSGPKTLGR